ncbi:MAG: T9SS type A sorting domain-containing protein [Chitinophagales bacterium]|nr:T9SS type A sorting domain-containing protein [Chitinophagales bacterium]
MQKSTIVVFAFLVVTALVFSFSDVSTNIVQPPSARTGAPGELTCGTSDCHNNTPNSGAGSITIGFSDPGPVYLPGNAYTVTVTVTDAAQTRFGFEITALDATNSKAGTFAEISGGSDISFPVNVNGRLYASHHNSSATQVWSFTWTAPVTDVGPVTFYAAGNAANNNNEESGDHIYTTTLQVASDSNIGIDDPSDKTGFFVQSPVSGQVLVRYETGSASPAVIRLYNSSGQMEKELLNTTEGPGSHFHSFDISEFASGIYFIQLKSGTILHTEKILID